VSSYLLSYTTLAYFTDVIHHHCVASHNTQREHIADQVELISLSPPPNKYITQCHQTRRRPSHWHEAPYELKMSNHLAPDCLVSFHFPHLLSTYMCFTRASTSLMDCIAKWLLENFSSLLRALSLNLPWDPRGQKRTTENSVKMHFYLCPFVLVLDSLGHVEDIQE
jgi:hypothetical protein